MEHPEITMALKTGYPRRGPEVVCSNCGLAPEDEWHEFYIVDTDRLCPECFRDWVLEEIQTWSTDELAELFPGIGKEEVDG